MSLAKIPFVFLFGLGLYVSFTPFNPKTVDPKKVERTIRDGVIEPLLLATFIPKYACFLHAAIELVIILAAAGPKSTIAESILTFLLPHKDPSRIFLSPTNILATVLMGIGAYIRFQCYRELGQHFTYQVTILKNHKLVTSGPYSYVRHPSYTGISVSFAGIVLWYTTEGSWLMESEVYRKPLAWIVIAPVMTNLLLICLAIFQRMPKEDEALRKMFGKEWDEWARKVPARFLPGIY